VLDDPEVADRVQKMSDAAVTLLKDDSKVIPLTPKSNACMIVMVGTRLSQNGQRMVTEFRRRTSGSRSVIVDPSMPLAALEAELGDVSTCSALVVAAFSTGSPLGGDLPAFIEKLTQGSTPVVFIAMGSPYTGSAFSKVAAYMATFSATLPS